MKFCFSIIFTILKISQPILIQTRLSSTESQPKKVVGLVVVSLVVVAVVVVVFVNDVVLSLIVVTDYIIFTSGQ